MNLSLCLYVLFLLTLWLESDIVLFCFRGMVNGNSFMKKQELIDAVEASGLSRTAIA